MAVEVEAGAVLFSKNVGEQVDNVFSYGVHDNRGGGKETNHSDKLYTNM